MFTHMSSTQCNHQHCPHTFPICSCSSIFILAQMMSRDRDSSVNIVFRFKSFTPKMLFHMSKQPVITWGEIWKVGWMCQHLPAPLLYQILHIMMAMKSCTVLEQNDTMFKQFWFTVNSQPDLILQECAVILAIDCRRSSVSPFQLKNMTSMTFRATWLHHAIFFPGVSLVRYSVFCCCRWVSNECIHDLSTIKMW